MGKQYWTPRSAQLQVLESIFNQENKIPSKSRITQIVSELSLHEKISNMNVYDWFTSRRARLRKLDLSKQAHDSELVIQPKSVELQKDLHVDENIGMAK
ncbi:WUSCHEL-related homeobox 8-like [Olea europaea var. sylvestris]|uniref:WUSCHEL-related homeobox 8-like n=1 Tax=Olea europaea var. sylvestris TaxID=158386 RepID=UPI000C1D2C65|nr:WUSCHEL-related homeobox 8-like [Olea europaea var. sylvestris]